MKYKVLVAAVILVARPPLPWTHTIVRAQTTDQHGWIGTETVKTRFGDFEFKNGYPTAEATDKLYELRTFNRAVESYLHFVTIMSMFYMQKGLTDFGLDAANKFLIFERMDSQTNLSEFFMVREGTGREKSIANSKGINELLTCLSQVPPWRQLNVITTLD